MRKTPDPRTPLSELELFSHSAPSLFLHLNPYADLFFAKCTRIPHPLPRCSRPKPSKKTAPSSTRQQVLSCVAALRQPRILFLTIFRSHRLAHLTPAQRTSATAIRNPLFLNNLTKCLPARTPLTLFNLETHKTVNVPPSAVPASQEYFEHLLIALRVCICSEPVLYLKEEPAGREGLVEWLDRTADYKLFEYNCDGEENLLWFNSKAFRPLAHALVSQFQQQILQAFRHKSDRYQDIQDLKEFLRKNNKNALAEAMDVSLEEYMQKSDKDMAKLLEKIKVQEEKLQTIKAERLFLQMESQTKTRKNRKRTKKRKDAPSSIDTPQKPLQADKEPIDDHKSNHISESPSKSISQDQEVLSSLVGSSQERKQSETDGLQLISTSPEPHVPEEKQQQSIKECHSDHQQSTNQNEKSISKSESTSHLDQTFHHEDIPNNSLPLSDQIKEEKLRKRRKRRVKKEQSALEELRSEIRHKFMTRQLENISELINSSTNKMLQARVMAFERVRILIQNNYPFSNAVLFGSNAIGLALPSSDVDILVVGINCINRNDCAELLNHIGFVFSCMEWAVSCELYANAKVPVLKLEIDTSIPFMQLKGSTVPHGQQHFELQRQRQMIVKVDITINVEGLSSGGYESTLLMKKWLEKFPFAQKIVILFKHLLSYKHLNQNYRGGIGSYCLFVMVMAYIQENPKCIDNQLSRTFIQLLEWYSQAFNNEKEIVWLRQDGPSFVSQEAYQQLFDENEERRGLLRLVDPTTSRIMSGSCSEYIKIKDFFKEILQKLNSVEAMIEEELKSTTQNHAQLSRMFQNRRQSQKWFKNAQQKHSWALMKLMGIDL